VLFDIISDDFKILYFHGVTIVSTNNNIIYNGRSHEFLIVILDMFLNELFKMLYDLFH
jgi:hypothetical protein